MAIGDVFYEVRYFDNTNDEGERVQFLAKTTVEDPARYTITTDDGGALVFTPKPECAPPSKLELGDKYRLEPEGGGYRLVALRNIVSHGILAGTKGGLVENKRNLSQQGDCWINEYATVRGGCVVDGQAYVGGDSVIDGACYIAGMSRVLRSQLQGNVVMTGIAFVDECVVEGTVALGGDFYAAESRFTPAHELKLNGCTVRQGHITHQYELVSYFHQVHGWLSAYPDLRGNLRFQVGCQNRDSADGLRQLARKYFIGRHGEQMLEAFLALVEVARVGWSKPSEADQDGAISVPVAPTPAGQ